VQGLRLWLTKLLEANLMEANLMEANLKDDLVERPPPSLQNDLPVKVYGDEVVCHPHQGGELSAGTKGARRVEMNPVTSTASGFGHHSVSQSGGHRRQMLSTRSARHGASFFCRVRLNDSAAPSTLRYQRS
jgi:hypothetical protein